VADPRVIDDKELQSLVGLLDDEDGRSLEVIRSRILQVGERALPFLNELKSHSGVEIAERAESVASELRFRDLRRQFVALSARADPDLEAGVFLIARFGYPGLSESPYRLWLDRVAERVHQDLPAEADDSLVLQRLRTLLFQAMGFSGNETHYYDPDNSYLNRVIDTRRGIPVTLSILLLLIGRRLGLPLYGVGIPGHFLVGFRSAAYPCFIDAFHRGRLRDLAELRKLLKQRGYPFQPEFMAPCSSREILLRMVRNLIALYDRRKEPDHVARLGSLAAVLFRHENRAGPASGEGKPFPL
jgi:regulator of sirC expression with transglutaminase-like and TPR domain